MSNTSYRFCILQVTKWQNVPLRHLPQYFAYEKKFMNMLATQSWLVSLPIFCCQVRLTSKFLVTNQSKVNVLYCAPNFQSKLHYDAKLYNFLTFTLINLWVLVQTINCTMYKKSNLICSWKYERTSLKVGYFQYCPEWVKK